MFKIKPELQAIVWDFDGVILNSNAVREIGFREVLREYDPAKVEQLLAYHHANGGLSRYVKFAYFFDEVLKQPYLQEDVLALARRFSLIMKQLLTDKNLLIEETIEFIKENFKKLPMHIISGSDGEELRYLCQQLGIDTYFHSIEGSPTPKVDNLRNLIIRVGYNPEHLVLVGDAINDYQAASANGVAFLAYNNTGLEHLTNY